MGPLVIMSLLSKNEHRWIVPGCIIKVNDIMRNSHFVNFSDVNSIINIRQTLRKHGKITLIK